MPRSDVRYDEYLGGERTPHNYISVPSDGKLYRATKKAIHYTQPTHGDDGRMLIPSVALEYLLQGAPIAKGIMVLTHCLAEDYLGRAVDLERRRRRFAEPPADALAITTLAAPWARASLVYPPPSPSTTLDGRVSSSIVQFVCVNVCVLVCVFVCVVVYVCVCVICVM